MGSNIENRPYKNKLRVISGTRVELHGSAKYLISRFISLTAAAEKEAVAFAVCSQVLFFLIELNLLLLLF